jgi:hypothetical protein
VKDDFAARLARARPRNRPQYRRIKALALLSTGDPVKEAAGHQLLEHVVGDPDAYPFEKVSALCFLGAHEHDAGRLVAAADYLRAALNMMSGNRSGGTELEEVRLAEILLVRGQPADLEEARDLLDGMAESRPLLLSSRFRKCQAGVRVALAIGDEGRAAEWARLALRLAAAEHSGLANHPKLGLVETDDETIAWLSGVVLLGRPGSLRG